MTIRDFGSKPREHRHLHWLDPSSRSEP